MTFFDLIRKSGKKAEEKARLKLSSFNMPGPYVDVRYTVEWLMPDGSVRVPDDPEPCRYESGGFAAAGKQYSSTAQLCARELVEGLVYQDIYGREVFAYKERFPCFDSYDYLYEHRYYRWFYIREGNSLSRVYSVDERDAVEVKDDIRYIDRQKAWEGMRGLKWQDCID